MVPVVRTLEKECFIYRYFFIYLNFLYSHRWKKAYEKNGLIGPRDSRKTGSGRPLKRELTPSKVIERQSARIKLLERQVELLKKLEATERWLLNACKSHIC
jgi:putative transposase